MMIVLNRCKQLFSRAPQSLPQQHRLLGLDALTSLQLIGRLHRIRLRGRCTRCHSDPIHWGFTPHASSNDASAVRHAQVREPYL